MSPNFTPNVLEAPLNETVCWCSNVSKQSILDAIEDGARTMADVRWMTGACALGRCKELSPRGGCCSIEINLLLEVEIKSTQEKNHED